MKKTIRSPEGFTLMELLVVVAIIGVLMGVVAASVTGTKSTSVEGQVKSDGKATQTSMDNFNNKSIKTGAFPEKLPDAVSSADGASNFHIYGDVFSVGDESGANVVLRISEDDSGERLADTVTPSGKTAADAVFKRRLIDFNADTAVYDDTGEVKTSNFVPDFLGKLPTSLPLKGDETKDLGAGGNRFEEYLWLLSVNAPSTDAESRTVQVYRMVAAYCTASDPIANVTQPDPAAISSGDVGTLITNASGCDDSSDVVNALIYEQLF